jgi:hypothetical protein
MKLLSKLQISLSKRPGNIVLRRDIAALGSKSHLSNAIKALIAEGRLVRLGPGLYAKTVPDAKGALHLAVSERALADEIFQRLGLQARIIKVPTGAGRQSYALDIDDGHAPPPALLPANLNQLPTSKVREFVEHLARAHGVQYQRSGVDAWAEAVTRASGDDVSLDPTGELLVALKKKRLLDDKQFSRLLTNHTREVKHVRSVRGLRTSRLSPQH